jgi:Transposase and inactivated derivatives
MPNKQTSMQKIRQVLRCCAQGKGTKSMSGMLNLSRNTIKKYLQKFRTLDLSYQEVLALSDSELSKLFNGQPSDAPVSRRQSELEKLLPSYCKRLKRKGVTRKMLHEEYLELHPDGLARSRFNDYIRGYEQHSRCIMHLEHKAGDKVFIDFAGSKQSLVDVSTGEVISVEVFVAILPCSQLTYVEAVPSQKKEDLIAACEHALFYFEGVPQVIVPDNLKSAVTKSSKYEAIINDDFACFAEHYGCTVIPARAYKPRDKALVEGAVKLIYRSIYTRLEGRVFHDLESLNTAIGVALEVHNNTPFSGRNYSRRDQFEEIERTSLSTLNPIRYEQKKQSVVTVMKNGHIKLSDDHHYYSVPCKYIGSKVKLLYNSSFVEVYYRYEKIAEHPRDYSPYRYTTVTEHLSSHHRYRTDWCAEKFIAQASIIHPEVASFITKVIESKTHPEQAYKTCSGILSFARRVGAKRLINACRWAESYGLYNYPVIDKILKNRQDELPLENSADLNRDTPVHENIRGKEYYT